MGSETKGLDGAVERLKAASTAEEVASAIVEVRAKLGPAIPTATVAAIMDELARRVVTLQAELSAETRTRELLLSSVAHDLRNPLNTFAMSTGLLRDDVEAEVVVTEGRERALSLLTRMDRASNRMQSLIEDLLEASRALSRALERTPTEHRAGELAREAIAKATPALGEKSATIAAGPIDEEATLIVDRRYTVQLLFKLTLVALRVAGAGAVLRLGVETTPNVVAFCLIVTAPNQEHPILIEVDEGRGGLALTLVHRLLCQEGGRLTSEMRPSGARTVVTFPRH